MALTSSAQSEPDYYDEGYNQGPQYLLSAEELDDLLAPIALYPDPLIAQILPAATFIDQIEEAARYVRQYGTSRVDDQPWDISVRAVAHYPDVLSMMNEKYDWTVSLGQAFIEQRQDVMDAIQRLRVQARENENLYSTPEQQVLVEDEAVRIVPANPEYLYVPVYDPNLIYVDRYYYPGYPFLTFSSGYMIGPWLNRDCDWHRHRVYYHGWRGRGWIARSRPHIHDTRGIYISKYARTVRTNDRVLRHDTRQYREQLRETTTRRLESRGLPGPATTATRPRTPRGAQRPVGKGATAAGRQPSTSTKGTASAPSTTRRTPSSTRKPASGVPSAAPRRATPSQTPAPAVTTPGATAPAVTPSHPRRPATEGRDSSRSRSPEQRPAGRDVYRGTDAERREPASSAGDRDATMIRERGQSREYHYRGSGAGGRNSTTPRSTTRPGSRGSSLPGTAPTQRPTSPAPSGMTAPRSVPSPGMTAPRSVPSPGMTAPRSVPSPGVTTPRSVSPAPAPVPRSISPAPRSMTPAPRATAPAPQSAPPVVTTPMPAPSSIPATSMPGGMPAMPGGRK